MSTVSQQTRHSNKHNDKPVVPLPLTLNSGIRYMLALWLRHRPQALLLLLVLFIYESYKTFFSLTLRSALDSLQNTGHVPNLGGWLGTLLAVVVLTFGARWVGERIMAQVGTNILNHLRRRMFEHVQRLSQSYFARTPIGETLARFSSDLAAVERGATNQLRDGEGEIVFRQGEVGDKLYLIARGQVEVLVWPIQGADRQQDAMRRIDTMQDGDHFGEMALLYNVPRNATIRTLTECLFLTLPKGSF